MGLRATTFCLAAMSLMGYARGATEGSNGAYEVTREAPQSSSLKIDWKGPGHDTDSGQIIDVPAKNGRRMIIMHVDLLVGRPMLSRSILDAHLKGGRFDASWVHTERIEASRLVRAYLPNDTDKGDFFFKPEVGRDLDAKYYVAQCSVPFPWEKGGAIHCQTRIIVEGYQVEIHFDKAFLWDFDAISEQSVAAVKDYVAKPSTRRLIESRPKFELPRG